MIFNQENTIKDDSIEKYVSLSEALEILNINIPLETKSDKRDARAILINLKIRDLKIKGKIKYHINDINKVLESAKKFFNDYYVLKQIETIPENHRNSISSIDIPSGYNYILYSKRFPSEPYRRFLKGYKKTEVDTYMKEKEKNNAYIPLLDVIRILQIDDTLSRHVIYNNLRKLGIDMKLIKNKNHCKANDIDTILKKAQLFFSEHYTRNEIPLSDRELKILVNLKLVSRIRIPIGYNILLMKQRFGDNSSKIFTIVYKKSQVDPYILLYKPTSEDIVIADNNYLSFKDTLKATNYSESYFLSTIMPVYNIKMHTVGDRNMYHKSDIDDLLTKQKDFFNEYTDSKTASETYLKDMSKTAYLKYLNTYPAPPFAYTNKSFYSIANKKGVYRISEIEELILAKNMGKLNSDIEGETPLDTFMLRLDNFAPWTGFDEKSKYTKNKWFEYVKESLNNETLKGSRLNGDINRYVKCTKLLKDMLDVNNKTEVYMLTAPEINLYKRGLDSELKDKAIYYFIKEVYSDILTANHENKKIYRISDIEYPIKKNKRKSNNSEDVIFDFKEFATVFQYAIDTDLHTKKSIKEIEEHKTCIHASTWLYTMLHLNNAWRHGDVRDFPKIKLNDLLDRLEISDIVWFKSNSITLAHARDVVERVRQWEFIISKTQIKGRFFCSDELAIPLATSIIILTLFSEQYSTISSEILMDFTTKYNDVSDSQLKKFFNKEAFKDFKFSSRKFNKTVMTYITYLANLSGDKKAIEYAKWIRAHVNINSTLHYIDFNIEAVEELSKMLFARGEFGYVSALLLKRLTNDNTNDFKETTEQVYYINELFGNATKLNTTVGFLNTIRSERAEVAKYISSFSLKECQEKLTDLFARKLPSKEGRDIQCLFSKVSCQKPNLDSCFECPFHIPTIYALSSLCDSLKQDFKMYYFNPCKASKIKISIKIHRKKLVFSEAIERFGEEYVVGCLGMTLDELIDNLSEIPNPLLLNQ